MKYSENGTLTIRVYTAGGAIPIKNTTIHVFGADENNRLVEYSVITDIDGITEAISLPSPARYLSLQPNAPEVPYSSYDIEISADGYYTKRINNVPIFSGTNALQSVNMIPIVPVAAPLYPRGTLDTNVYENELLEK